MEIELPYNVSKTGESSPQFPLYFLDRSAGRKPDTGESLSELRCPEIELEQEQEAEGKKEKLLSISKYFGVEKTHGKDRACYSGSCLIGRRINGTECLLPRRPD